MIKLKSSKDRYYDGKFISYEIIYDRMSGRKNRYNVLALTCDDPVVIGRELDLSYIFNLIKRYEKISEIMEKNSEIFGYPGERKFIYSCIENLKNERNI